ncbi:MAG TPA: CopG family transcriptional regulator [Thermoanaerobaculia bacterium]|jgi:metal-responsive CopG/Arc/MetJ family transcriptional regulator|nr:CopG family transcriptional regulator [Thermoanaerobaculia bacterium]
MSRARIAITVEKRTLAAIDQLIADGVFPNRSNTFETVVQEHLTKLRRSRLARECTKLDPSEEQAIANERYVADQG